MTQAPRPEEYNEVVERATLVNVRLTSSSFEVSHDFRSEEASADKFIDYEVEDPHFDSDSGMLIGSVHCRVWMNRAEAKTQAENKSVAEAFDDSLFAIDGTYVVVFRVLGNHSLDAVSEFFRRTAYFTAWPYFRGLVAHLSSAGGLALPVLPIQRLTVPMKSVDGYRELAMTESAGND